MADLLSEEDLKGINLSSKSELVDTFNEAFEMAKNKYTIFKLYLMTVADEVKEYIASEYNTYVQSGNGSAYVGSKWKIMFE